MSQSKVFFRNELYSHYVVFADDYNRPSGETNINGIKINSTAAQAITNIVNDFMSTERVDVSLSGDGHTFTFASVTDSGVRMVTVERMGMIRMTTIIQGRISTLNCMSADDLHFECTGDFETIVMEVCKETWK